MPLITLPYVLWRGAEQLNRAALTAREMWARRAFASLPAVAPRAAPGAALTHCLDVVRQHDYENFLATLLMSKAVRSPALVVRAFNVEVARVQDQTTDSKTAQFRLQFWQETLDKIFMKGESSAPLPAHPVAQELYKICSSHKLPKRQFEKLIRSRSVYLKTKYFRTLEDVEKYSEESVSTLFYIILAIANITNIHADHVASHLGKAQGICNLLRSVEVASSHKTVTLPLDVLTKHGVSQEDVLRCKDNLQMREVTYELASRANSHLDKARNIEVPKAATQVFLCAVAVDTYLTRLQQRDFNIFDKALRQRSPTLPFVMYYKRLFRKY